MQKITYPIVRGTHNVTAYTLLLALSAITFVPGCNSPSNSSGQTNTEEMKETDDGMRDAFERMLKNTTAHPVLHRRIQDLRNEWEVGKDDPQKLAVVKEKLAALKEDIKNDKY